MRRPDVIICGIRPELAFFVDFSVKKARQGFDVAP